MASDVVEPVRVDRSEHPRQRVAIGVATVMSALVVGGAALAVTSLWRDLNPRPITLTGHASTQGLGPLAPGRDYQVYLVVPNDSDHRVRIVQARSAALRVDAPGCDPASLRLSVDSAGLEVGAGQQALLIANLRVTPSARAYSEAGACTVARLELPVVAEARRG